MKFNFSQQTSVRWGHSRGAGVVQQFLIGHVRVVMRAAPNGLLPITSHIKFLSFGTANKWTLADPATLGPSQAAIVNSRRGKNPLKVPNMQPPISKGVLLFDARIYILLSERGAASWLLNLNIMLWWDCHTSSKINFRFVLIIEIIFCIFRNVANTVTDNKC